MFVFSGSVHCAVHRPGFPSGVRRVLEGQRDRGLVVRQGDGLPRGSQLPRNIQQRIGAILEQRKTEGGEILV